MLSSSHFDLNFSLFNMSNSDLLEDNQHQIQFNLIDQIPNFIFQDSILRIKDQNNNQEFEEDDRIILQLHREEEITKHECAEEESTRQVSLGELKATEDNDGFKTPNSSDRKIPEVKQCPPAPRKPKPIKRKASDGNVRRNLRLDLSEEVKSLFPRPILADFNRKIKKARTEENLNSID